MKRMYKKAILACGLAVSLAACTDVWEEHYQPDTALTGDKNLWELISDESDLSNFAALLSATRTAAKEGGIRYDSLLMMSRSYTVWAPTNANMPKHIDYLSLNNAPSDSLEKYRKEIVENHIANYAHVAGGIRDREDRKNYKMVEMLNGKSYHFEGGPGVGYKFAEGSLVDPNEVAKNGVLHKLDGRAIYLPNIWEKLGSLSSISSLYAFLEKDYKIEFNEAASIPGPIVGDQLTFLDSAFTESCRWFYEIGQLDREDSLYTMYALTNEAWDKMFDMTKSYFEFPAGKVTLPEKGSQTAAEARDSIAREMICRNLVFSNTINRKFFEGTKDSLYSNHYSRQMFVGDEARALEDGTIETYSLSNGTLHVVDQVNYNPFTCWHDTIRIEGESLWYQTETDVVKDATASAKSIDRDSLLYQYVSNGSIGIFTPTAATKKPSLCFYLDNVLSSYYKVSIVLLPPHIVNPLDSTFIKPNKFDARLHFPDGTSVGELAKKGWGTNPSVKEIRRSETNQLYWDTVFVSDPTKIDTIVLAECIKVPCCEYQRQLFSDFKRTAKLEITTIIEYGNKANGYGYNDALYKVDSVIVKDQVLTKYTFVEWNFDNNYRIDQVILEPVAAPSSASDEE